MCVFVCQHVQMPMFPYLEATLLHAATGFEVGSDPFASTFLELWELAAAGLNDGLYFLFGLLWDWNHPVQVLIHKQPHKHLKTWRNIRAMQQRKEKKMENWTYCISESEKGNCEEDVNVKGVKKCKRRNLWFSTEMKIIIKVQQATEMLVFFIIPHCI